MANFKFVFNISNILTIIRILLTPVIIIQTYYKNWLTVFILIFFIGSTDWLDGYLARKLNQVTDFGKILDPIADKFFLIITFFSFIFINSPSYQIPFWFLFLIIFREAIILIGSFIFLKSKISNFKIAPTIWGKLTTFFQLLFIFSLFIFRFCLANSTDFCINNFCLYKILLFLVSIFSIISLFTYINIGIKYLRDF